MKTKLKRIVALVISALMICSLIPTVMAVADGVWSGWTYTGWTLDGDVLSYGGTDMGAAYGIVKNDPIDSDRFCAKLNVTANPIAGNGHIGLLFTVANGDQYYFMYATGDGYSCIKKWPAGGGETFVSVESGIYPTVTKNTYVDFEVKYDETSAKFYIGGNLCHTLTGDYKTLFKNATVRVLDYGTPLSVKCPKTSANPWKGWTTTDWTSDENDYLSNPGTDMGRGLDIISGTGYNTNCYSIKLRKDGNANGDNGHMGLTLTATNGDKYYFKFATYFGYSQIIYWPAGGGETGLNATGCYPTITNGVWNEFKVVITDTGLDFYINNVLNHSITGDYKTILAGAKIGANMYATPVSISEPDTSAAIDNWSGWSLDGWTKNRDGSVSNPGTDMGRGFPAVVGTGVNAKEYSIKIRKDGTANAGNGHVGLQLIATNGDVYYFMKATGDTYSCIKKFPAGGGESILNSTGCYPAFADGVWHEFKVVITDTGLDFYIDNALNHSLTGDYATILAGAKLGFSMYATPCTIQQPTYVSSETSAEITNVSLVLGSDLTLTYYAEIENYKASDSVSMKFTRNEETVEVAGTYNVAKDVWTFDYEGINPQCMTDPIDAELYVGGEKLDENKGYTVKAYCETLYGLNYSTTLNTLVADLLTYGAEAQKLTGYRTTDLSDAVAWVATNKSTFDASKVTTVKSATASTDAGKKFKAAWMRLTNISEILCSVDCDDATGISVNFYRSSDGVNFTADGSVALATSTKTGTVYEVSTGAIAASDITKVLRIDLCSGETVLQSLTYSVDSYVNFAATDATFGGLVKALHNYGISARDYLSGPIVSEPDVLN